MRLGDLDALDKTIYEQIPIKVFGTVKRMAAMREIIQNAPTVDAVPVVHGAWTEQTIFFDEGSEETSDIADWQSARCSVCKRYLTTPYMYYFTHYDYCPNCGAKMDGKKVDE